MSPVPAFERDPSLSLLRWIQGVELNPDELREAFDAASD